MRVKAVLLPPSMLPSSALSPSSASEWRKTTTPSCFIQTSPHDGAADPLWAPSLPVFVPPEELLFDPDWTMNVIIIFSSDAKASWLNVEVGCEALMFAETGSVAQHWPCFYSCCYLTAAAEGDVASSNHGTDSYLELVNDVLSVLGTGLVDLLTLLV